MPPRQPRVPGEVVETVPGEVQAEAGVDQAEQSAPAAEETVTVSKASLDALLTRVNALESKAQSPVSRVANNVAYPDQSEVDVTKIKSPVLTKQGWVVPETFGANPALPKAF